MTHATHDSAGLDLAALIDLLTPWAVRVAATLRIADLIAEGCTRLDELAAKAGADADALGRLLRYLACCGVFAEPEPGIFALTETARQLQEDHPSGMRAWLDLDAMAGRMDTVMAGLLGSVRSGGPSWEHHHGQPFWEDLSADPRLAASFNRMMAVKSTWFIGDILAGYDWAGAKHVVDVGGGAGVLLTHVLGAHARLRGTIVELAEAATAARDVMAAAGLADRCAVAAGSFFDPLPADGDRYVLWNVLHDWTDAEAVQILRRCAEAAGSSGRVLVIEFDEQNTRLFAGMSLRMLVWLGGRERTLAELTALASTAGLDVASTARTPSGLALVEFRASA